MKDSIKGMVKINLRQARPAYLTTGILLLACIASEIVGLIFLDGGGNSLSLGDYFVIFPLLLAIIIPAGNYFKLMNLGGTRMDFFKACLVNYAIAAFVTALLCFMFRILDPALSYLSAFEYNLFDVFGFIQNGAVVAILQMTCFLFFCSCAVHALTLVQGRWYGWVTDGAIIALISLVGVGPIQAGWVGFFKLVIFNEFAIVQIVSSLAIGLALYSAGLFPLRARRIGA
jgi:hypothetical protein